MPESGKINRKSDDKNPFFVRWLNPLGGFDSWLFGTRQTYSLDVEDVDIFEPVINYLQVANGLQQVTRKEAFAFITVGAEGLTQEDVIGIGYILQSPLIYWIDGDPTANDFQTLIVGVKPGSYKVYDNGDGRHSIEITFILPKRQTQSQ